MRYTIYIFIVSIVLLVLLAIDTNADDEHHKLFQFVNVERENDLVWDDCLAEQAEIRAKDIYESGEFNHDGWSEYAWVCGDSFIGENLVWNFSEYHSAHNALMNSELHKKNIL